MLLEDRGDCGGPPQTGRSGWRQQDDQSDGVLRRVEVRAHRFDRRAIEVNQRGLTCGRIVRGELLPPQHRQDYHNRNGDPPPSTQRHQGNHAAIMAAMICGNSATSTTIVPEMVRIATDPRLRVEHCRCARFSWTMPTVSSAAEAKRNQFRYAATTVARLAVAAAAAMPTGRQH